MAELEGLADAEASEGRRVKRRPACPNCADRIHRMQRSLGVVAAYPCNCWLTPAQAQAVADSARNEAS